MVDHLPAVVAGDNLDIVRSVNRVRITTLVVATCVGCLASGCATTPSSGAPPLSVRGRTLWNGAEAATLVEAGRGMSPITSTSSGDLIFVRVSRSCWAGSWLSVPPKSAVVVGTAESYNGKIAAVVLKPIKPDFSFMVRPASGKSFTVVVQLR